MKKKWNLAIVEPNHLVCAGFAQIFARTAFRAPIQCPNIEQLWRLSAEDCDIDIFLLSIGQSISQHESTIEKLKERFAGSFIVLLAETIDHDQVAHALKSGAHGFISKAMRADAIVKSLELIQLGERVFPAHAFLKNAAVSKARLIPRFNGHGHQAQAFVQNLSSREFEVLRFLGEGRSNKEIARQLEISDATVKVHVKAILRKLRVKNRTKAALWVSGTSAVDLPLRQH